MTHGEPPALSADLLASLDRTLCEVGVPVAHLARTGLSDGQIDELMKSFAFELSAEARCWWNWRNGTLSARGRVAETAVGPHFLFVSLEEAVAVFHRSRAVAKETADAQGDAPPADLSDPDYWWEPAWFPFGVTGGGVVAADLDQAARRTPVLHIDWAVSEERADWSTPKAASMGQLVTWWIEAIDDGVWTFHPERGWDSSAWERTPQRAATGLF